MAFSGSTDNLGRGFVPTRRWLLASGATLGVAGCSGVDVGGSPVTGQGQPQTAQAVPGAPGTTIGSGSVRVALILPLSVPGNAGVAGANLRNAAEMAIAEFQNPDLTILVKDDGGSAQGAQAAAQAALQEGAELFIGPLLADAVRGAAAVARPAGRSMIAFSTDTSVATRGVYLMSFTPQASVERVVQFAAQQGKRAYAAFLPDNAFGQVMQGAFQETVAANGGRVVAIERFPMDPTGVGAAASRLTGIANTIDAIFVPDPFDGAAVRALGTAGVNPSRVQVLGAGPWDGNVGAAQAAPTAVYAAADTAGFRAFAARYKARFGADPIRIASLAYDSVSLIAALVRTQGANRFAEATLTSASGFNGVDGLFRFRADGSPQRGLAILRAGGTVVSPAPRTFTGA